MAQTINNQPVPMPEQVFSQSVAAQPSYPIRSASETSHFLVVGAVGQKAFYHDSDVDRSQDDVIRLLMAGEYLNPIRVLAIDEAAGTVVNVSSEIAQAIARRILFEHDSCCREAREFCHWHGMYIPMEEEAA